VKARSATQAIGAATAAMLSGRGGTDVVARLVRDCLPVLAADAIGVVVRISDTDTELLAATSHRASELELYQIQQAGGPCFDAMRDGEIISGVGADELVARWADVGQAIVNAGFLSVHAYPMRWHEVVMGGLNVFAHEARAATPEQDELAQAFADLATVAIASSGDLTPDELTERIRIALETRTVIERAKGVLAWQRRIDPADAYDELLAEVDETGGSVVDVARDILRRAQEQTG